MARERLQNPIVGDTVNLRLFVFNGNQPANLADVEKVEIYKLGAEAITELNTDGRSLVATIAAGSVDLVETGEYLTALSLTNGVYTIGRYVDLWYVTFENSEADTTIENYFEVKSDLWFTDVAPIVHDFSFRFQPNRIAKGSKKYITIEVVPVVPRGTDLERYYRNLITLSSVKFSMAMKCGDCLPAEEDLRIVYDDEPTTFRDGAYAYFFMDTTDIDCGLYDVQFSMDMGPNTFVSDKQQLLIF